jgi:hypothetical protein
MAIQKLNNKTTHTQGEVFTKDGFLKVVRHGRIEMPSRKQQLDATNVCYLSKARVAHNFSEYTQSSATKKVFTTVPIIHASKLVDDFTIDVETEKYEECWAPFNEKITEYYNGTNWCDRVDYSFVTTTHIYFCTLYIRRSGTFNAGGFISLAGNLVDYYIIMPSNNISSEYKPYGGGLNISEYLIWDFYDYDENDNLTNSDSGTLQLNDIINSASIESFKYSPLLHLFTGG